MYLPVLLGDEVPVDEHDQVPDDGEEEPADEEGGGKVEEYPPPAQVYHGGEKILQIPTKMREKCKKIKKFCDRQIFVWIVCEDREALPLYGILIPSPSCAEEPLDWSGAGVAESMESWRGAGAEAESYKELTLILVVFS